MRHRLHEKSGLFPWPGLLTLTVDLNGTVTRGGFASSEVAYEKVTRFRFIPRLMAKLGIRRWVSVLEFQKNGNPHWHVLFDRGGLPGGRMEYHEAWRLWRDLWQVGMLQDTGLCFKNAAHAINYVTKYLTDQPDHGYPSWLLERRVSGHTGAVRFLSCSREVGPLFTPADDVGSVNPEDESDWHGAEDVERAGVEARRYADVISECGNVGRVFEVFADGEGTLQRRFVGELPVSTGDLVGDLEVIRCVRLIVCGDPDDASGDAWVVEHAVEDGEGGVRTRRRVYAPTSWLPFVRYLGQALAERFAGVDRWPMPLDMACGDQRCFVRPTGDFLVSQAKAFEAEYAATRKPPAQWDGGRTAGGSAAVEGGGASLGGRRSNVA